MVDGTAPVVEDVADLLWVVNQDSVEIHPWLSRKENLDHPDLLVFDLDPGSRLPFQRLCEAATVVKEALDALGGVNSWVKTSGASGLHLLVGIKPEYEFEEVHPGHRHRPGPGGTQTGPAFDGLHLK